MAAGVAEIADLVRIRAQTAKSFFATLGQDPFPRTHIRSIADFPGQLIDEIISELPSLATASGDALIDETKLRQLRRLGYLIEYVHTVAEFLESSHALAIPASFALYLEDAIRPILPNSYHVVRADSLFNYQFEPLAKDINSALAGTRFAARLPERLGLFKFPAAMRDDALLHATFAHEAGHFLDEYLDLSGDVLASSKASGTYADLENTIASGLNLNTSMIGDFVVLNRALDVFQYWVGEIVSDLVGVHMLGPAFALALEELSQFDEDPTEADFYHPPMQLRRGFIEFELDHLGWLAMLKSRGLWTAVPPFVASPIDPTWPLDRRLFELLAPKAPDFIADCQSVVRALFAGKDFIPNDFVSAEPEQASLIDAFVPPAEHLDPDGSARAFTSESIINACWLFWAAGARSWSELPTAETKRSLLSRLMFQGARELANSA